MMKNINIQKLNVFPTAYGCIILGVKDIFVVNG